METLVASAIGLMLCMIVALTASNLMRARRVQDEVSRQTLLQRTLDSRLRDMVSTADVKGVHVSEDGHVVCVQQLSRVSTDGERQWSAVAHVVVYDPGRKTLVLKAVPFSDAGLTSTSSAPVEVDPRGLRALAASSGQPLATYDEITDAKFTFSQENALLSAQVRRAVHTSKKHEDELLLQSAYGLRSSTELKKKRSLGIR